MRSYADQDLILSLLSMRGAAVRQMEKRGIQTNIGNLNREIRAANRLMKSLGSLSKTSKATHTELERKTEGAACAKSGGGRAVFLPNLLMKECTGDTKGRAEGLGRGLRRTENRQNFKGLKRRSRSPVLSQQKGLSTVEEKLEHFMEASGKSAADYRNQMKPKEARSKVIDGILASRTDCKECEPVYEKYAEDIFKKQRKI